MTTIALHNNRRILRGFTLIEMLVVISIIVILITLVVTSGMLLIGRQDRATTRGILSTLDRALEEYVVETGAFPPFIPASYEKTPGRQVVVGGDENVNEIYLDRDQVRHPDASVFLRQAQGVGQVNAIISNIGDRFTVTTEVEDSDADDGTNEMDTTPSIVDAWGDTADWAATSRTDNDDEAWSILHPSAHLIFYVHPNNRLAQDLYGRCVNGRPYFFSAGPDGLYGTSSQFTEDGSPDPTDIGVNSSGVQATYSELAILGMEDNLYSYSVGPARDDDDFNQETR